jgi:outer membrane protein assembly factor BamD
MKRAFLAVILIASLSTPSYAYWIWTPKTKKFINPKYEVKTTPKEQYDLAKGFYDVKSYDNATREFKKLLKAYPKSKEAAESQYFLGRIEEDKGNLYEAYQAYQRVIEKYPFSERIQEMNEREFAIAEQFTSGVKRKALGVPLPVDNPAIEIYGKVVENSTFGPLAPKAQYKLGLLLKSLARFGEAEDTFDKVIKNYPDSEWSVAAKFQLASCRAESSQGPEYDQGTTKEAKQQFEEFLREHPDAVLSKQAEENILKLQEKEAQGTYRIATFYEKQNAWEAAKIYYNELVTNYPDSTWAAKAVERLQVIEKRNQKKR